MKPTRIFDLLDRYILKFPDKKDALSAKIDGEWINYSARQYHDISHHFAYGLIKMGFRKGDKIITITNNRPEWNFVDMGMSMIGIIHVPVFTSLTCDEYRYVFEHSDSKMVMISDKRLLRNIKPVCDEVKQIKHVYTFNKIEDAHNWLEIVKAGEEAGNDIIELTESIKSGINEDDFASLIYTSGTTGRQKGVMLSHKNMVRNFLAATDVFKLGINDRYLSILPLCHVGGRMGNYQTQFSGASIYYAESMGALASTLKEIKAKGFDAVPRVIEKIYDNVIAKGRSLKGIKKRMFFWAVKLGLEYKPFGQKSWFYYRKLKIADKLIFSKWRDALGGKARIIGCGGASLQPRHERIFWAAGIKILNMYGLT
ncbi:MAG TPA: long-chain fatty acid--CoA ligase, partial [Bacteroidales bacterium]|nr:long-chain fatty acid--CoA ligase [Bacteroidales bacterium]